MLPVSPTALTAVLKALAEGLGGLSFSTSVGTGKDVPALRTEAEQQEIKIRMIEAQAKAAQELAIAEKIRTAENVEIEEEYEYSAQGQIGAKTDGNAVTLGASAAGSRVAKRTYRFKSARSDAASRDADQ